MLIPKIQETEEKEIWKVWKDNRGKGRGGSLWELSTLGNVRRNGEVYTPLIGKDGYLGFSGWNLHRAVAELFLPNPLSKPTVDHINRIKTDNRVSNLRWATYKEQAENRKSLKGVHLSYETKLKISESEKGKYVSKETRKKLSDSLKGSGNPMYGIHHSEEARRKMREAWARRKSLS